MDHALVARCAAFLTAGLWKRAARLATAPALGLAVFLGGAQAQTPPSPPSRPLPENGSANPTKAWTAFCERLPAECAVDVGEPAILAFTADLWDALVAVNAEVNTRIRPVTDWNHWGVADRWDYPDDGAGDCEDIQLLKRRMLVERGLSRRALPMTVVLDEAGEGHAVLMARTTEGDFILDNRRTSVLPWVSTGYTFVKREGQDGMRWVSLGGTTTPLVVAAAGP